MTSIIDIRALLKQGNTTTVLPQAIREAETDATIVVSSVVQRELGIRAADRMGREDLIFTVGAEEESGALPNS